MFDRAAPRFRVGDELTAGAMNALAGRPARVDGAGLSLASAGRGGAGLRRDSRPPILATLSGDGPAYDFAEISGFSYGGPGRATGRTGTAYEVNGISGLAGHTVRAFPDGLGSYRFQRISRPYPSGTGDVTVRVRVCDGVAPTACTVTITNAPYVAGAGVTLTSSTPSGYGEYRFPEFPQGEADVSATITTDGEPVVITLTGVDVLPVEGGGNTYFDVTFPVPDGKHCACCNERHYFPTALHFSDGMGSGTLTGSGVTWTGSYRFDRAGVHCFDDVLHGTYRAGDPTTVTVAVAYTLSCAADPYTGAAAWHLVRSWGVVQGFTGGSPQLGLCRYVSGTDLFGADVYSCVSSGSGDWYGAVDCDGPADLSGSVDDSGDAHCPLILGDFTITE